MTRILVCDLCGEVLAVGDTLPDTATAEHKSGDDTHAASTLLETDETPPDGTPDEILAWALSVAGDATEVG